MRLNDKSAGSLAWFAGLLLVPGVLIMSPTGRILFIALAALIALIPVIFGSMKRRIFGGVVLLACLAPGVPTYLQHQELSERLLQKSGMPGKPAAVDPAKR